MVLDGIWYACGLLAVSGLAWYLGGPLWAAPELLLAAFVLYFFRDPERTVPEGEVAVSPADGRVVDCSETQFEGMPVWKISVFLNVFNVHVNRSPIAGMIRKVHYTRGKYLVASRPEASSENEQNTVTVEGAHCTVVFKQIAGLIARRIVFTKKIGDRVECGERIGLIKFGSRVDVFLPAALRPQVSVGERVQAGTTVLASLAELSASALRTSRGMDREPVEAPLRK